MFGLLQPVSQINTATIEGTITKWGTTEPIAGVSVYLGNRENNCRF